MTPYVVKPAGLGQRDMIESCIHECFIDVMSLDEILHAGTQDSPVTVQVIYKRNVFCGFGACCETPNHTIAVIVAVLPGHRRRGAARTWLDLVESTSARRHAPLVLAATNETNRDALEFLKACKYKTLVINRARFVETVDECKLYRDQIVLVKHGGMPADEAQPPWLYERAGRLLDLIQARPARRY